MVYIILGKGFEEAEAIIPCDLLRRAGVDVRFAGIGGREIVGGHGICVQADCVAEETELDQAQMLVLPGGLGGVASIRGCAPVMEAVRSLWNRGGYVAAICAAPTLLSCLDIPRGKRAVCYPGMEEQMTGAICCDAPAVTDGKLITGKAAGTAFDFGLLLVEALCGKDAAKEIAASVFYQ